MTRTTETIFFLQKACRGASGVESSLLHRPTATRAPHAITTSAMMIGFRDRGLSPGGGGKLGDAVVAVRGAGAGLCPMRWAGGGLLARRGTGPDAAPAGGRLRSATAATGTAGGA
jgi:hypothetical protein